MQNSMKTITRRLQRLEKRFALVVEAGSAEDSPATQVRARRLAQGEPALPPETPEALARQKGMSLSQVLNFDRHERWRKENLEKTAGLSVPAGCGSSRLSAQQSQGNWASSKAMAVAVVSWGASGSGTAGNGVAIRARRARWLRP
jgi:hypothetical protein